jgi:hypothetical protein
MFGHTENVGYFDVSDNNNYFTNLNRGKSINKEAKAMSAQELLDIETNMA